jgi:hypothetical protein
MQLPSAIIFVNSIDPIGLNTLSSQLHIHESMSHQEFNDRILVDPNYPSIVKNTNTRILVLLPSFLDKTNRDFADIVIFVKLGLAAIEKNKVGPHGFTVAIQNINVYQLLKNAKIVYPTSEENFGNYPLTPQYIVTEDGKIINGIFDRKDIQDRSGVHLPNPDNEYNNPNFINRKF